MRLIPIFLASILLIPLESSFGQGAESAIEIELPPPRIVPDLDLSPQSDPIQDKPKSSEKPLDIGDYGTISRDSGKGKETGWLGTFLGLIVVIGLIYLTFWIVREVRKASVTSSGRAIKLLESLQICPGRTICLLEIGDKLFAVAFTQGGIGTIAEVTDPEEVRRIKGEALKRSGVGGAFSEYLASFQRRLSLIRKEMME